MLLKWVQITKITNSHWYKNEILQLLFWSFVPEHPQEDFIGQMLIFIAQEIS